MRFSASSKVQSAAAPSYSAARRWPPASLMEFTATASEWMLLLACRSCSWIHAMNGLAAFFRCRPAIPYAIESRPPTSKYSPAIVWRWLFERIAYCGQASVVDRMSVKRSSEGSSPVISSFIRSHRTCGGKSKLKSFAAKTAFRDGTWSRSFPAESEPELRSAVSEGARWIRQSVGEHADDLARRDRRPEEATTSSWEAQLAYVEAERANRAATMPKRSAGCVMRWPSTKHFLLRTRARWNS